MSPPKGLSTFEQELTRLKHESPTGEPPKFPQAMSNLCLPSTWIVVATRGPGRRSARPALWYFAHARPVAFPYHCIPPVFQQVDIEHYQGQRHEGCVKQELPSAQVPIMRLFGVTAVRLAAGRAGTLSDELVVSSLPFFSRRNTASYATSMAFSPISISPAQMDSPKAICLMSRHPSR